MTADTTDAAWAHFDNLSKRGTGLLGSKYSVMGGAMSWLSERSLVAAISNAGGFGVIACGSMNANQLDEEIKATSMLTNCPFGVNLITMHPDLEALIEVCIGRKVTHVALAGSLPTSASIKHLVSAGIKVIAFAPALAIAKRLVRSGVNALVIEGLEAGGHIGPVSTSVLAQEILPVIKEVPVFVAGGIGRGEALAMYLEAGASGVQMGTRFVCATESIAHPAFKKAFIRANARDAILSIQLDDRLPVIPVRALANKGTDLFMQLQRDILLKYEAGEIKLPDAQLEIEHFWAGALRRAAIDGDTEYGSVMAGQSIGLVSKEETAKQILDDVVRDAVALFYSRISERLDS